MRKNIPKSLHAGKLKIGGHEIDCAVLPDGTRVLSQKGIYRSLGASWPSGRALKLATEDGDVVLPAIIAAKGLRPFINKDLLETLSEPLLYYHVKGGRAIYGFNALIFTKMLDVLLKAREAGALHWNQIHIAKEAEILLRAVAHVGVIALIDEATGYDKVRPAEALKAILELYIDEEFREWQKTFPDEYYEQLDRLWRKGLPRLPHAQHPKYYGKLTNRLIYRLLPSGVLGALKKITPQDRVGRYRRKLFQSLTDDTGMGHLQKQIVATVTLMKVSPNRRKFEDLFARRFREQLRLPDQLELPGFEIPDDAVLEDLEEDLLD